MPHNIEIFIEDEKVVLKADKTTMIMSAKLARDLGEKLYQTGCDLKAQAEYQD